MIFKNTSTDPARTRTWNLLIRSQAPYPLGHRILAIYNYGTFFNF